jgi:type IV fimbrial biogenesis protein FimT
MSLAFACIKLLRVNKVNAPQGPAGLSVLELLIAVAVAAVIAAAGIPALRDVGLTARRAAAVNEFTGMVQFARSSAQTRAEAILLCHAGAAPYCSSDSNETLWIVRSTSDAAPLRTYAAEFSGRIVSNRALFEFRPFPHASTNGTVSFCDPRRGTHDRAVVISRSGRARVERPESDVGLRACASE